MRITGVEVLRHKAGASVEARPGQTLQVTYGDTVRITTSFEYRGRPQDITLYGSIGQRQPVIGFVELLSNEAPPRRTPDSPTNFIPVTASVDITITADINPGSDYDIQCKILEYAEAGLPEVDSAIYVTGIPPTYELLDETIYPYAYIYKGDCEISTFTFKTDPFTPANWAATMIASAVENEVRKAGGKVMEMRVFVDKAPLLWTDWRVEVVGIPPQTTASAGMATGIAWWGVAIIAALVIIGIIAATLLVKTISEMFKTKPGLADVKVGWGKETLIMTIQDSEEFWKITPTPIETLQGMTEGDLRHYLNKIAEENVPTGVSWLPWAIIGGVAVVGVSAAVAISSRKR